MFTTVQECHGVTECNRGGVTGVLVGNRCASAASRRLTRRVRIPQTSQPLPQRRVLKLKPAGALQLHCRLLSKPLGKGGCGYAPFQCLSRVYMSCHNRACAAHARFRQMAAHLRARRRAGAQGPCTLKAAGGSVGPRSAWVAGVRAVARGACAGCRRACWCTAWTGVCGEQGSTAGAWIWHGWCV